MRLHDPYGVLPASPVREALHQDPARKDISWLLGIDEDVMNEDIRQAEVRNWVEQLVIPTKAQRS